MQPRNKYWSGILVVVVGLSASSFAAAFQDPRYQPQGQLLDGAADWVSMNRDRLVFGSAKRITIATAQPSFRFEKTWDLEHPAIEGLVIGSDLYFIQRRGGTDELVIADLGGATPSPLSLDLDPAPRGALHIAQMDDYLLVAEDGLGVRVLRLPGHQHSGHHGHHPGKLAQVSLFRIDEPIQALGVSLRAIYVATPDQLLQINASLPSLSSGRRIALERPVHALAANRDTVHLLSDDGMRTLELSQAGTSLETAYDADVQGNSLLVLGRDFFVATGDGGLDKFRDTTMRMATTFVAVGDTFFSPAGALNINVGDTVQWDKPGTIFQHNVFSCNSLQAGCSGQTATETFTSGVPTTSNFRLVKTFSLSGNNPYVCQIHSLTMQGNVMVSAGGPPSPPGVPDTAGVLPPMRVSKPVAGGATLGIQFDTSCPNAVGHDLIFGNRSHLPAVLGGAYLPNGSQCAVGLSPFMWNATPNAPVGDFIWWLLVADDGVSVEGSWGKDAAGAERNGLGLNGASGLCANNDKDLTNTCGQ